jgi:hypothetical protein
MELVMDYEETVLLENFRKLTPKNRRLVLANIRLISAEEITARGALADQRSKTSALCSLLS